MRRLLTALALTATLATACGGQPAHKEEVHSPDEEVTACNDIPEAERNGCPTDGYRIRYVTPHITETTTP